MSFKIKLSHQRKPRGLHALQALAERADREVTRRRQELAVLTELDAENSAAVDHAGELVAGLHSELDQLESDLDQFIKKEISNGTNRQL